jgi:hypothetical protein
MQKNSLGKVGDLTVKIAGQPRTAVVGLSSEVPYAVATIKKPGKGTWLAWGFVGLVGGATSVGYFDLNVSKTTGETSDDPLDRGHYMVNMNISSAGAGQSKGPQMFVLTDTDDLYLNTIVAFSGGTCGCFGKLTLLKITD